MSHPNALASAAIICSLLLARADPETPSQGSAMPAEESRSSAQNDLIGFVNAEARQGTYLFYTQTYRDEHHQEVFFKGSVFGAIRELNATLCKLEIKTTVTDHYSGNIGERQIGETSSVYQSSFDFTLTSEIADGMRVVEARPVQLGNRTNPSCPETPGCILQWVELKATHPEIREIHIANDIDGYDGDVKDFDGVIDHFLIPVSSSDAGSNLISRLRAFAKICGKR